ncbi:hypothetical protein CRG98_031272 [Punica granatum]|uniref:Uncharacterized protein n=1 Tax=Punica granatum TaxID=22663 RepID=A0A2I0IWG6_PUNGR|nr:hypothetical protein CRG98_031272 [Punica granatum]
MTPTPPLRSSASSVGTCDLGGGVEVVDWRSQPQIDRGFRVGDPRSIRGRGRQSGAPTGDLGGGVRVAGTHGGRRRPRWRGQGRRLATPIPNLSRTPSRRSPFDSGLGPPINDPDPSTEVIGVLCRYLRPRWRGRGRRLAIPTPN